MGSQFSVLSSFSSFSSEFGRPERTVQRACARAWGKATIRMVGRNSLDMKVDLICGLDIAVIIAQVLLTSIELGIVVMFHAIGVILIE